MGCVEGFDDCVFRKEAGEEGGACEGKAAESQTGRGKWGKVVYTAYFADVLFVVQAVNNGAGAKEKHSFKEGMSADVKKGKLRLV